MTVVRDPGRRVFTDVLHCRSCDQAVYFSLSPAGKRAPFEIDAEGEPTRVNHFSKCPQAKTWRKPQRKGF